MGKGCAETARVFGHGTNTFVLKFEIRVPQEVKSESCAGFTNRTNRTNHGRACARAAYSPTQATKSPSHNFACPRMPLSSLTTTSDSRRSRCAEEKKKEKKERYSSSKLLPLSNSDAHLRAWDPLSLEGEKKKMGDTIFPGKIQKYF